ncbi:purine nucleotide synthesis repressoR/DNA complex regulatioN [Caudoviricetes sp.]|nr:purine nucleotide synthesis repressoR/DNA complex regulatioN [Caudoviricetes sp.]
MHKRLNAVAKGLGFPDVKAFLEEKYVKEHLSVHECAMLLWTSTHTLKRVFPALGIPVRSVGSPPVEIPKEELLNMKQSELMSKYNVSRATVWRRRKEEKSKEKKHEHKGKKSKGGS